HVWITRRIDIARHWRATHPFDASLITPSATVSNL
ncbi:MAG: hypothetical protein JWP52_2770, partial [Rhizobacter sp.]|nr:hypothetical protein [Rhizobacter sp.]